MGSIYDIFKVTSDGPLWVAAVQGLEKAKEQMARLALASPKNILFTHRNKASLPNRPTNFWKKYHDSDLHYDMPALPKHSDQDQTRREIQV